MKYIFRYENPEMIWIKDDLELSQACIYWYKDDPEKIYLSNVNVDKNAQRKGLGQGILRISEHLCKILGASSITLAVVHNSWVHSWYIREGYTDISEHTDRNLIWMTKIIIQ